MSYVGLQFGAWHVLAGPVYPTSKSDTSYICRCACGKEAVVRLSNLTSGRTTRCSSCMQAARRTENTARAKALIGSVRGSAVAVDVVRRREYIRVVFSCQCGRRGEVGRGAWIRSDSQVCSACARLAAARQSWKYPKPLRELGEMLDVTRQRAHQLVQQHGYKAVERMATAGAM